MNTKYQGKIIKGIAGFYYVVEIGEVNSHEVVYACKAKGGFRNQNLKPLVGDNVLFEVTDEKDKEGNITDILDRKNTLIRPSVSNVDAIVIVMSIKSPMPNLFQLDKYLVYMENLHIPIAICWNKCDLSANTEYRKIYQKAGYTVFEVSTYEKTGLKALQTYLKGHVSVLAGPSGVGKSSLTNMLVPTADMQTNTISKKIERGRHTTRHTELFRIEDDTFILDTPGFTSIDVEHIEKEELSAYFGEFSGVAHSCRFLGCTHVAEPNCAIKEALERGEIEKTRYESYVKLYEELATKRRY